MDFKPTPREARSLAPRPMYSRFQRFTPNCGYAEIEVVEHTGSHHKPGDIILVDPDAYAQFRTVPEPTPPKEKPSDARRKSKAKNQQTAR